MRSYLGTKFPSLDIFSLKEFTAIKLTERGQSYSENSKEKALIAAKESGLVSLADDSGLEVKALNGGPGAFSARFAGAGAKDSSNLEKLLGLLSGKKDAERKARFVCCMTLADPAGQYYQATGEIRGQITTKPLGDNGFGYDPIFIPAGEELTFAQLAASRKAELSHRIRALENIFKYFKNFLVF